MLKKIIGTMAVAFVVGVMVASGIITIKIPYNKVGVEYSTVYRLEDQQAHKELTFTATKKELNVNDLLYKTFSN